MQLGKPLARSTSAGTSLHDFQIERAAELGMCRTAQSFRARRQIDDAPVLLHKFRPAESLLDLGPVITRHQPPDFTRPFMTWFTDLFVVAGSAYLVEPLPNCFALAEVWRNTLLQRPDDAFGLVATLVRELARIVKTSAEADGSRVILTADNVVLSESGHFAVLAGCLSCRDGRLWLRQDPEDPVVSTEKALADLLAMLLEMEQEMAESRGAVGVLSERTRRQMNRLIRALERPSFVLL